MSEVKPTRQALKGSCHCGAVKYILWLTLPYIYNESSPPPNGQELYERCNCTPCHKMGLFHIKPGDVARDFLLLSPTDPMKELGDYVTAAALERGGDPIHFLFCKHCAVRCFLFAGGSETVELDLAELGVPGYSNPGTKTKVWRPTTVNKDPEFDTYVSVNAHTIDAGQTAFDMRDLMEKKQVRYLDMLSGADTTSWERPHHSGCY